MANNYAPFTVTPDITASKLDETQLTLLNNFPSLSIEGKEELYLYSEEGITHLELDNVDIEELNPEHPLTKQLIEHECLELEDILMNIVSTTDIDEIVLEGCFYCSRMRPGEFGGFVTRYSKTHGLQSGGTFTLLEKFRNAKPEK